MFGKLKASGLTKKQMKKITKAYDDEIKAIFGFNKVYNYSAYQLLQWAENENNRIKAYKLVRQAVNLEERYREFHRLQILFIKSIGNSSCPAVIQLEPEYYWKL